uniref:F-box domain-containing protein n=1 Tax=Pinguiococcus pyrenoidosus TaxID=172671 RepID=A0A7R9YCM3_9STRA|mmetsp:Transcript_1855/g.8259  ORF Transcript_1855/g.8259 Transcript_1855/m.8259 type:complete len:812 (+) Transcript_1855:219-2654(+)
MARAPSAPQDASADELGLLNSFCTALRPPSIRRRKSAEAVRIGECRLTLGSAQPSPVRDLVYGASFPPITHSLDLAPLDKADACRPQFLRPPSMRASKKRSSTPDKSNPLTPRFVEKLTRVHHIAAQELAEYAAMDARKAQRAAVETKDSAEDKEDWAAASPTSGLELDHRASRVAAFREALREACAAFDNVDANNQDELEEARQNLQLSISELEKRAPGFVREATKDDYLQFIHRINRWNLTAQLPQEVLIECLSWLSVADLSVFGTTCRENYKLSCKNVLWIPIYMSRYDDVLCYNDNLENRLRALLVEGAEAEGEAEGLRAGSSAGKLGAGEHALPDLRTSESFTERISTASTPSRSSNVQTQHRLAQIIKSIAPVTQTTAIRSRDMSDVSRVSVDVLPIAALQPYVPQGVVKDMLKNRHCVPYIGDQIEVSWKGKFRLEGNAQAYQGRAWWCANVVDVELDPFEEEEEDTEITVATLQMFTSPMASRLKVHYAGWDPRWDEWIERNRLRRAGQIPPSYSRTDLVQTQDPDRIRESVSSDYSVPDGADEETHIRTEELQLIPNTRDRRECLRIRPGDQVEVWCCGERVPGAWLESDVKEVFNSGQASPRLKDWVNVGSMIQPHANEGREAVARDLWVRRHRLRLARKEPVPQVPRRRSSSGSSIDELLQSLPRPDRPARAPWFGMLQPGMSPLRRRVSAPARNGVNGAAVLPVPRIEFEDAPRPQRVVSFRRRDLHAGRANRFRSARVLGENENQPQIRLFGQDGAVEAPGIIEIRRNAFSETNVAANRAAEANPAPANRRGVWSWLQ